MASREEIAGWLRQAGKDAEQTMPFADEPWNDMAAQVESMRCKNCNFWDCYLAYSKTTGRCIMLGFSRNADFGCFSFEPKEDPNATKP